MTDEPRGGLDQRKARILDAIVREFVQHGEPVGSKRIVGNYSLEVSAATVRNEMAALEESGYIAQPHTSAGRVPTDKGYRYFVDAIGEPRPLREGERLALRGFLGEARDVEELLRRTTQVLVQLTRHAAMVLAPALDRSRLQLVELVRLASPHLLLLLIADTGRVEKRLLDASLLGDGDLDRARTILNDAATGLRLAEVPAALRGVAAAAPADLRPLLQNVADVISADLTEATIDQVFVGGQAALAGTGSLETDELHRVFEVLEERLTLSRLLAESSTSDRPVVRIGVENPLAELRSTSIVSSGYGEAAPGTVGVIGPTRMDYPSALAAVKAVADQLQSALRALTES